MRPRRPRSSDVFDVYTRDVTSKDFSRLFTRDAADAYRALAGSAGREGIDDLRGVKRGVAEVRAFLVAFGLKLSPARRALFGLALVFALFGFIRYASGLNVSAVAGSRVAVQGAWFLLSSVGLLTLLVILEVADRLSLKNDLEIARGIQMAMLPPGTYAGPGVDVYSESRPANTVGGDFYDVRPLADGRLLVAVGDVAGKGSPAALLMALFLAMERVLLDECTEPVTLTTRLNAQVVKQAPGSRFITLFIAVYDPANGRLIYVNAGHPPALLRRADGRIDRLHDGGIALGLFEGASYTQAETTLAPGECLTAYSDGITEAEHPERGYFDDVRLEATLAGAGNQTAAEVSAAVLEAVRAHTDEYKLSDDLTILVLRRTP